MSQFAHGISAVDLSDPSLLQSAPLWLLGRQYDHESGADAYRQHFETLLWFTYRGDFEQLTPYTYTSDAGWGCMLRSAQMMLGHALQRRLLGPDWRLPVLNSEPLPAAYTAMLRWFVDSPSPECIYSLHNMVKLGMKYDMLPGEWYGPTTAAQVMRDLVNTHRRERGGALTMYVPQEGVVYSDDVHKLCVSHLEDGGGEAAGQQAKTATSSETSPAFFDPLLHPPAEGDPTKEWATALLILMPLRLGLDQLNEAYIPALQKIFEFPQTLGIIGGKKGHSVYYVGTHENRLHLLDPHQVQPTPELNASFPTATHVRTVHSVRPLMMNIETIDPSMALGFLCENRQQYSDFCDRVRRLQEETGMCPFSVADRRPDYDVMDEMCLSDASAGHESAAEASDDEDYVLI